jgi:hypothetical protein
MIDTNLIRKLAGFEEGKRYLKARFEPEVNSLSEVYLHKAASAEDTELLFLASKLPGNTLDVYESLGGGFDKLQPVRYNR